MDVGAIFLFLHVLGAMGYAAGTLLSLVGLVVLRILIGDKFEPCIGTPAGCLM
jgi:hypothetical protein